MKNIDINDIYDPNAPICPPWTKFGIFTTLPFKIISLPGASVMNKKFMTSEAYVDDNNMRLF